MALQFDIDGLTNEILNKLQEQLEYACVAWRTEALSKLGNDKFLANNAEADYEIKRESKTIIAYLKANTYLLADSYGTGSLMLTSNPGYEEYRNSDQWNDARKGREIVGRKEGTYKDIFGNTHRTSGNLEGINIEGMKFNNGYTINAVSPSYTIQMADQWLHNTYLPNAYKNAIKQINFAKYLKEV